MKKRSRHITNDKKEVHQNVVGKQIYIEWGGDVNPSPGLCECFKIGSRRASSHRSVAVADDAYRRPPRIDLLKPDDSARFSEPSTCNTSLLNWPLQRHLLESTSTSLAASNVSLGVSEGALDRYQRGHEASEDAMNVFRQGHRNSEDTLEVFRRNHSASEGTLVAVAVDKNVLREELRNRSENFGLIEGISPQEDRVRASLRPFYKAARCLRYLYVKYLATYRYAGAGKKTRKRIVQKNGECNVSVANVAKRRRRYLQDIFTTLVDIKWRWTLVVFAMSFLLSWLGFAVMWWLIALLHGDLDDDHLPEFQEANRWTPCVMNIVSFTSCFLFSIETQHTIGYGSRHTTEQCPHAIVVMCLQSITGVMIQAFMVGIVFAKLSRPKKRTQTLIFSRNMCILQRDGEMCLIFRVGDLRKSHIIEAHVRAQLIRKHVSKEGEEIPLFMYDLDVGYDVGLDRIFFIWPMTIVHKINEGSPLYDLSAKDLKTEDFEIVVLLEGVIESTGMTTQARSSYLPDEILWGHRFEPLVNYKKGPREGFCVDLSLFNVTKPVTTPLCSAREVDEMRSNAGSSAGSCDDGGKDVGEGLEDEEDKEADGTSSHSSQVTSLGPLSPHSDCTVAAAPLLSPNSNGNFSNSNVKNFKQEHVADSVDASKVAAVGDGDLNTSQSDTFNYDMNHLRNSGLLREGVRSTDPSTRHTIAFSPDDTPSGVLGGDGDALPGAYRRTISLPHKRDYVWDKNKNYCIQDKERHRNDARNEVTSSEFDQRLGSGSSSGILESGSNLRNFGEPSSNMV